jgi:hypothetical protein
VALLVDSVWNSAGVICLGLLSFLIVARGEKEKVDTESVLSMGYEEADMERERRRNRVISSPAYYNFICASH